jgi:hypothetical protein
MAARCLGCGSWHNNADHGDGCICCAWIGRCDRCMALGDPYLDDSGWNVCSRCGQYVAPHAPWCMECGGEHAPAKSN